MTTQVVKAIQTRYAGCHFRSRLEARWAVFFDVLSIRWAYEVEGFATPAGPYLPDFWLHLERPTLFEVKPESQLDTPPDPRWSYVADHLKSRFVVAYGLPAHGRLYPATQAGGGQLRELDKMGFAPGGLAFCQCLLDEDIIALELDGHVEFTCGHEECARTSAGISALELVGAFDAARSHRFESFA